MTVIIVVTGLVLGMFAYSPSWFDTRPHYYYMTYNNKYDCEGARELRKGILKDEGTVCTDKHEMYTTK